MLCLGRGLDDKGFIVLCFAANVAWRGYSRFILKPDNDSDLLHF